MFYLHCIDSTLLNTKPFMISLLVIPIPEVWNVIVTLGKYFSEIRVWRCESIELTQFIKADENKENSTLDKWTIDICEGTKKKRQRNNVVVDFRGGLHFFAHIFLYRLDLAQKIIFSLYYSKELARQLLLHWAVYKHSDLTNLRVDEEQGHFTLRQQAVAAKNA